MNAISKFNPKEPASAVGSRFRIDPHDRITIEGKPYRAGRRVGDAVELMPENGEGLTEQFPLGVLARLSAAGKIRHEVGYYLPHDAKRTAAANTDQFQLSQLLGRQKERFIIRYAQVMAIEELIRDGRIRNNEEDIDQHRDQIAKLSIPYLQEFATEQMMLKYERRDGAPGEKDGQRVRRRKGGKPEAALSLYSSGYLRRLVTAYQKHGLAALADNLAKSGNRNSIFRAEEQALLMATIKSSYLTPERKSIKATVIDVKAAFREENRQREATGLSMLRVPGRDAVRSAIRKLDRLTVMIARHGREAAIKELRPVNRGLEVSRPLERVEIDEWRIDLISILGSARLHAVFGTEFLEAVGLDNSKARWWLVAAIDCRTRVILGMKLIRNPSASASRECLRMIISDKGQWSDQVGALTPWSQAGVPETLVADNGPGFKAEDFTRACLDLGITLERTIAGLPGMRGRIERLFQTASLGLTPRLKGRTFSNPRDRGDYPAEDRACFDTEDVAFALIRWVVDIYHNTPHEGLGGLSPLEQWEADMADGNYPLRALPDWRSKRLALGKQIKSKLTREGVKIMGVRYHSADLAAWYLSPRNREIDIRWDAADLGAIEVFLDDAWREVPAVYDRFKGVDLHTWTKARRSMRAESASRRKWDEDIVLDAIEAIEARVAHKSAVYGLLDTSISDEEFENVEQSLFTGFEIIPSTVSVAQDGDIGREICPRAPDVDQPSRLPTAGSAEATDGHVQSGETMQRQSGARSVRKAWCPRPAKEEKK